MLTHFRARGGNGGGGISSNGGNSNNGNSNNSHCSLKQVSSAMACESSGKASPCCPDDGSSAPPNATPSSSSLLWNQKRRQSTTLGAGVILLGLTVYLFCSDVTWNPILTSSFASHDVRHPLRPRKKGLRITGGNGNGGRVRYLAFGGSSTWGNGLRDPNRDAYPYLLSPDAHNAAVRSGGYSLAAACTQTIVQDDVYDVILLEFTIFDDSLAALSKRLRQRFPEATILFVRLWHPSQIKYKVDEETTMDFLTFRQLHGNPSLDDPSLYFELLKSGANKWYIDIPDQEMEIKTAAAQIRGRYLKLPTPDGDVFAYPITMRKTMELFADDDLSKRGHAVIAESIRSHVNEANLVSLNHGRDTLGSWGMGDQCNLWYSHGEFQLAGRRLKAVEFDHNEDSHRHALEVSTEGSSFEIENPFLEDRVLYLTYMTSAMDTDDEMRMPYPDVRVSLNGRPTVLVEPYHDGSAQVEYARTSAVGKVPPGTSTVDLLPTTNSRRNFRLVGASFLPSDVFRALPMLEFDLEVESRDVVSTGIRWF